jgi:hypothetical protein
MSTHGPQPSQFVSRISLRRISVIQPREYKGKEDVTAEDDFQEFDFQVGIGFFTMGVPNDELPCGRRADPDGGAALF